MALKLLEKDIHEKQDSIVSLRRQLEDIKAINLQIYNKLQVSDLKRNHNTVWPAVLTVCHHLSLKCLRMLRP